MGRCGAWCVWRGCLVGRAPASTSGCCLAAATTAKPCKLVDKLMPNPASAALAALCRWPRQPLTCARCWHAACVTISPARPRWALVAAFTFCDGAGLGVAALCAACDCCAGRLIRWGGCCLSQLLGIIVAAPGFPAVGGPLQFCLRLHLPQMMVPPLLERFKEKNIVMSKVRCWQPHKAGRRFPLHAFHIYARLAVCMAFPPADRLSGQIW